MFKYTLIIFIILTGFCYSQEISKEELDKLPPEVRVKVLEALEKVKEKVKKKVNVDEFTEEDLKNLNEKQLAEEKRLKKEKEVHPKLPEKADALPIDKAKVLELINQLGANHFKIRKKAKIELTKLGYQVIPVLKETLIKSSDPEVTESIKEIIAKLSHRLHINQLSEQQKNIAKLPFKIGAIEGPKTKAEFYNSNEHFIIDIGLTRLVFPGVIKQVSSSSRRSVNMTVEGNSGGGGSSSSNNFKIYQYSHDKGVGYWTICGHSFTVSSYMLEIKKSKLNLKPERPQVLYFDKESKAIGIFDLK